MDAEVPGVGLENVVRGGVEGDVLNARGAFVAVEAAFAAAFLALSCFGFLTSRLRTLFPLPIA